MQSGRRNLERQNALRVFIIGTIVLLFIAAFAFASPMELVNGMKKIISSRDALITDYFELAGYGAGFLNAGLLLLMAFCLIEIMKIPYTGLTLAAFFIYVGFGFWGKNIANGLTILLGTWIYAKLHGVSFSRYVYTALFATCLSPLITELVYLLPFPWEINVIVSGMIGVFVGYVMPPLSMHTASMHMGYNLFNVGFSGGILAFVICCVVKTQGIEYYSVFCWKAERHPVIIIGLFCFFAVSFLIGLWMEEWKLQGLFKITRHPGRAVADFVLMDGPGVTLMNMGLMGIATEIHVLLVDGDMSGPILGCILTVYGFAAFGAHLKNYIPVMLGVYISTFFTHHQMNEPGILIAACFCVGLAPIAGQFGPIAGFIAGMLHAAVVVCTSQMYGGLNLYNNGFSAGWVAIVMLPVIESFMKHYELRKLRKKKKHTENE